MRGVRWEGGEVEVVRGVAGDARCLCEIAYLWYM